MGKLQPRAFGFGIPRLILIDANGKRGSQSTGNSLPVGDGRSNRKDEKVVTEGEKVAITIAKTAVSVYKALYQRGMAWQFRLRVESLEECLERLSYLLVYPGKAN